MWENARSRERIFYCQSTGETSFVPPARVGLNVPSAVDRDREVASQPTKRQRAEGEVSRVDMEWQTFQNDCSNFAPPRRGGARLRSTYSADGLHCCERGWSGDQWSVVGSACADSPYRRQAGSSRILHPENALSGREG